MDYSAMTTQQLIDTWNAIMANAYPGDETEVEAELEKRGAIEELVV